jgi:hypothetical protein
VAKAILVEIFGDAHQFQRELDKAAGTTRRFGALAKTAGLAAATGLAIGLEKSVAAAVDAQDSQRRLAQSFKNAGLSLDTYRDAIDKAQKSGRTLGFTDTEIRDSLGSLITATHDAGLSIKDLHVAQDLARFTGKDLVTTTKYLTSAMSGSQRAIKALGLAVSPVTTNVDKLKAAHVDLTTESGKALLAHAKLLDKMATGKAVIDAAATATRGQATAFAESAAGGMAKFHAELDHLEVVLGTKLLPYLTQLAQGASDAAAYLSTNLGPAFQQVAGALGHLGGPLRLLGEYLKVEWKAIIAVWKFELLAVSATIRGVSAAFQATRAAVVAATQAISSAVTTAWNAVVSATRTAWSAVVSAIRASIGAATSAARAVGTGIQNGLLAVIRTIDDKVRTAFHAVVGAIRGLVGAAASAGRAIGEAVARGVISGLTGLAGKAAGIVRDAISHLPHINIPGFSPIEHVGYYIGQLVANGMQRGLREHIPKLLAETRGTLQSMANAAGAFANSIFPKLRFIGQRLAFELSEGFKSGKDNLAAGIAHQKKNLDQFVTDTGISNMATQGTRLAAALTGGFNARTGLPTVALPGGSGSPIVGSIGIPGGGAMSTGGGTIENHTHVYLDGKEIWTSVQRQGLLYSGRNAAPGIT